MNHCALLIPGLERIGGAERQLLLLARGLRQRGWRVTILALTGSSGACGVALEQAGIGFRSFHMRKGVADPRGWIGLNVWLWREKPDLLHAHLPHATWMARWSRLLHPRLAVVDTLHSTSTGFFWRKLGYRASDWLAGVITAVSVPVAEAHSAARLVNPRKLVVVPNGVDTQALRPSNEVRVAARRELGLCGEFLWVAAGRLVPVKDYPTLLAAMLILPEEARLAIAGDGPLSTQLRTMVARLGLEDRVQFLGFVPDVSRILQAADAAVLSSLWEGLPLILLEAGAICLPSVATNVPGLSQMVVPGETGWLAERGDPAALAQAMLRLMQTPVEERHRMGQRARLRIEQGYSLEAVLDQWEQVYAAASARVHGRLRPPCIPAARRIAGS